MRNFLRRSQQSLRMSTYPVWRIIIRCEYVRDPLFSASSLKSVVSGWALSHSEVASSFSSPTSSQCSGGVEAVSSLIYSPAPASSHGPGSVETSIVSLFCSSGTLLTEGFLE
jgi:hypothetical protein